MDAKSSVAGTALHCAAAHGKKEVAKILLDNKANVSIKYNVIIMQYYRFYCIEQFNCSDFGTLSAICTINYN